MHDGNTRTVLKPWYLSIHLDKKSFVTLDIVTFDQSVFLVNKSIYFFQKIIYN